MAREGVWPQHLLHLGAEPIEGPAQVRGTARHEDSHRRRQSQHVACRAWSTRCRVSVSAPAGTRSTCPPRSTISRTGGTTRLGAARGTSVNTTGFAARALAGTLFTGSPARRKTCRHQVSVLSAIPCCCPNSRSLSPLRSQRANTRRICRARGDVVDPSLLIARHLRAHSVPVSAEARDGVGHTLTELVSFGIEQAVVVDR